MKPLVLDLVRDILDHVVVDADGVPCGMVDDIELDATPGQPLVPTALLIGPGAWLRRLPTWTAAIARPIWGTRRARVSWSEIVSVSERIALRSKAVDLGLGEADRRWSRRVAKLPHS